MEPSNTAGPLLSIVIATRNRAPYAISAIQSILEIQDARLELVVQDNSESRDLEAYVQAKVCDSRFRYRYTPPPFSSIDNFNAAVELATGEYVCLIGDDDGVNPEIMAAAEWAKNGGFDSLAMTVRAFYIWPNAGIPSTLFTRTTGGFFQLHEFRGTPITADPETELRKLVNNGGLYHLEFNLPKLYHGLLHRRCLKTIRDKTGAYLGGLSPDIFSALSVACIATRVAVTDYPLTISGACQASTTAAAMTGKHRGRFDEAPHLRDRDAYEWCKLIPRCYSLETIWAESGVAALLAMGRNDLVQQLNLPKLGAHCIRGNPGLVRLVLRDLFNAMRITGKNRIVGAIQLALDLSNIVVTRFTRRLWNRLLLILGLRTILKINGVTNMVEVTHTLTRHLEENGRSFRECAGRRMGQG
jgi:glycosyltransferase involved in cell wall biosynthesis